MEERWFQKNRQANFKILSDCFQISEITARIIVNRDIKDMESFQNFVFPKLESLAEPECMKDMKKGVFFVLQAIEEGKKIRIVGDYDVDGVMSTYILYQALLRLGAKVDYEIPDRILDGYGINQSIIDAASLDEVSLILTCDNGIAAIEAIAYAKELGMIVVITDHHDIPFVEEKGIKKEILPNADAIINPKQNACSYPYKELCGAGVAWQFVRGLFCERGISVREANIFLENVAIATVCDVMTLSGENRILVKNGLDQLTQTRNIGMRALLRETKMEEKKLSAYHCGFIIGPCINATGRLESAKEGLSLLLCEEEEKAALLAEKLTSLNEERKAMTAKGVEEAKRLVETTYKADRVLVLYLPDCHESIAGIIAGRIREYYYRPTLLFTYAESGVKGSGRSTEEYNMFEELSKCKSLFSKFGGHPMAAGFSMAGETRQEQEQLLCTLREELNQNTTLTQEELIPKVSFDMVLSFDKINEKLLEEFKLLEPFGKGNPKPLFAKRAVMIRKAIVVGKNKNVVKLFLREEEGIGREWPGILFQEGELFFEFIAARYGKEIANALFSGGSTKVKLDILFYPEVNEYQGYRTIQFVIEHYR